MHTILPCTRGHTHALTWSLAHTESRTNTHARGAHSSLTRVSAGASRRGRWLGKTLGVQRPLPSHLTRTRSRLGKKEVGWSRGADSRFSPLLPLHSRLLRLPFPARSSSGLNFSHPHLPARPPAVPTSNGAGGLSRTLPGRRVGRLRPKGRKRGAAWLALLSPPAGRWEGAGQEPEQRELGARTSASCPRVDGR